MALYHSPSRRGVQCRFLSWRWALLFSSLTLLLAVSDPFLGDGHHGTRVVNAPEELTLAVPLLADVREGDVTLQFPPDAGFVLGDLVLLHRTATSALSAPERDAGRFELEHTDLGRFQFFRLVGGGGGTFTSDHVAELAFPAAGTQAVLVYEFTDLTITNSGRLFARPWDGASGGIVALLARGVIRLDGAIDASGAGSRGGAPIIDSAGNAPATFGCVGLDEPSPRGAFKGESFYSAFYGPTASGAGRAITGGGGGVCHNSGGGGGGHAGAGGKGGASWSSDGDRDVGGQGGMPVLASPLRLTFGGGGGAGEAHHGSTNNGGCRGGGIIFLRAESLTGAGELLADGVTSPTVDDAAGGAGAGGTVHVATSTRLECGRVSVRGGEGGINPCRCEGTSGGGGGGRVLLQADVPRCPADLGAGLGGHFPAGDGGFEFRRSQPDFTTLPQHAGELTVLDAGLRLPPREVTPAVFPRQFGVGCGCSGGPGEGAVLLVLLALHRRRYAARRAAHDAAARPA